MPVVIAEATKAQIESGELKLPMQVALIALAKEGTLPSFNAYQAGNTVFVGHRSKKNERLFVGRAINIDTPNNFIENGLKYFIYLTEIGVRDYVTFTTNKSFVSAFKLFERGNYRDKISVETHPSKKSPDKTVVWVHFNEKIEVE